MQGVKKIPKSVLQLLFVLSCSWLLIFLTRDDAWLQLDIDALFILMGCFLMWMPYWVCTKVLVWVYEV
jgi:hypothetical protein